MSSEDNNGKLIFSIFTLYFQGCHFLSSRFDTVKLDKILDPEMNFRVLYKKVLVLT